MKRRTGLISNRSNDFHDAMKLLEIFIALLLKPTTMSFRFCTPAKEADKDLPLSDYKNWNNKNEQPSIDVELWDGSNPSLYIRIRFCLIFATNTGGKDLFRGRPDHPIPNEINSREEMYEYMYHNDYHFCVVSLRGKDPHFPVRFAAGRYDSIPFHMFVARNKYDDSRERKNHLYATADALLGKIIPVGLENKNLIHALTKLIAEYESKQSRTPKGS